MTARHDDSNDPLTTDRLAPLSDPSPPLSLPRRGRSCQMPAFTLRRRHGRLV